MARSWMSLRGVFLVVLISFLSLPFSCPLYQYLFNETHGSDVDSECAKFFQIVDYSNSKDSSSSIEDSAVSPTPGDTLNRLPHEPFKNNGLLHFDRLPIRKRGFITKQASSYDWSGNNQDFNHFISIKGDKFRIFEDYGMGCILRTYLIFTSGSDREIGVLWEVVIEVDGDEVFRRPIREMSTGAHPPYLFPLAGMNEVRHGYFHYVPIFYKKSCIITIDAKGYAFPPNEDPQTYFFQALYYIFTYHKYNYLPSSSDPPVYRGNDENIDQLLYKLHTSSYGPIPRRLSSLPVGHQIKSESMKLKPGINTVLDYTGSGAIIGFYMKPRVESPNDLLSLVLKATWDEKSTPQVNATLGLFFGSETGNYTTRSYVLGYRPDIGGYCHFPMPFWKRAVIQIDNKLQHDVQINFLFDITTTPYPKEDTGYFRSTWHRENPYEKSKDYILLKEDGRWGHIVAVLLNTRRFWANPIEDYPFEGDERFYIDDEMTCAIHGTGTEDYFNTGHLFDRMHNFSMVFHGNPFYWKISAETYNLHAYRIHLQDFLTFHKGITMGMETAPSVIGWTTADYTSLVLYYGGDEPGMVLTDEMDVGKEDDEKAHQYSCSQCEPSGEVSSTYDAHYSKGPKMSDYGRHIRGSVQFTVKVDPRNTGVMLRRRLDHRKQNQKGKVFVDEKLVNVWFEMKKNPFHAFRNSDFWIPRDYTAGKKTIRIRIEPIVEGQLEGQSDIWTEFHYWVYSEI
eukprot:TRINITY_DN20481_c0_g1_i1.p1 TRINITY_DN20481_c0_g1~~TRINITY_DN20481_c0_g1_i1.p1  ORF type:complete len:734 (-),score=114.73 TRINITY_DN20481_c0_g1_i1:81-2282(-)